VHQKHPSIQRSCTALLAVLCFFLSVARLPAGADQQTVARSRPQVNFCGERLAYDMNFWLFRRAATGSLLFEQHPQGFRSVFEAETCGLIKLIAGHRKEIMESIMEYDPAKGRLRPLMFQETFSHGSSSVKKTLVFDYEQRTFTCTYERNGKRTFEQKKRMPNREFDDLLSFLYNFRAGYYGTVRQGMLLKVCVLVKDRPAYVSVNITAPPSRPRKSSELYYAVLSMDRDLTQARSKSMKSELSRELVPVSGVVEDAYFFGDLVVTLTGGETAQADNATADNQSITQRR